MNGGGSVVAASEPRGIIIVKFARWTAASAARQGCDVRGAKWYEHLDRVDLASLLALAPVTQPSFLEWHQGEVQKVASSAGVPIGWAAKMVNMLVKVHVYLARRGDASLLAFIHPPIDSGLVAAVRRDFPLKGPKQHYGNREIRDLSDLGVPISGVTSYAQYLKVIDGLMLVSKRLGCTLFEVEHLWDE